MPMRSGGVVRPGEVVDRLTRRVHRLEDGDRHRTDAGSRGKAGGAEGGQCRADDAGAAAERAHRTTELVGCGGERLQTGRGLPRRRLDAAQRLLAVGAELFQAAPNDVLVL